MKKIFQAKLQNYIVKVEESPKKWDVKNVSIFFSDILEITEYAEIIKKKKINGKKFLKISTEEGLKELGISKMGQRRLVLQVMKKIRMKFGLNKEDKKTSVKNLKKMENHPLKRVKSTSLPDNLGSSSNSYDFPRSNSYFNLISESSEEDLPFPKPKVEDWSNEDIMLWLRKLKLENYFPIFRSQNIRGDILFEVNEEILLEIGITVRGHIKKILSSIDKLKNTNKSSKRNNFSIPDLVKELEEDDSESFSLNSSVDLSSSLGTPRIDSMANLPYWDVSQVCEWFSSLGLDSYKKTLVNNQVDGNVLLNIQQDDLEEIGISSMGHRKRILNYVKQYKSNNFSSNK